MLQSNKSEPKSNVVHLQLTSEKLKPKAAEQIAKTLAKGTSKAKTAKTPKAKQKIAEKIKANLITQAKLTAPSELARCRAIVSGDLAAATLLYRAVHLFRTINPKMKLPGDSREFIAMTQKDWAISAGLSDRELQKRALPRLKSHAFEILKIEVHGNGSQKKTWIRVDLEAYREALNEAGCELKIAAQNDVNLYG